MQVSDIQLHNNILKPHSTHAGHILPKLFNLIKRENRIQWHREKIQFYWAMWIHAEINYRNFMCMHELHMGVSVATPCCSIHVQHAQLYCRQFAELYVFIIGSHQNLLRSSPSACMTICTAACLILSSVTTWHSLDEFPEWRCHFSTLCAGVVVQGNFPLLTLDDCFCYITA